MTAKNKAEKSRQILIERIVNWAERGMEALWLLALVLVPLTFLPREYLISESELAYVDLPKTAMLRTLVALMAMLWLLELGLQGRFPFGDQLSGRSWRLTVGDWLTKLVVWLRDQPSRWLILAVVLYMGSVLLSTSLSVSFSVSMWGLIPGQDTYPAYTVISYVLLFGVVATHLRVRDQLDRLLGAIVLTGVLVGGVGVLQHHGYDFLGLLDRSGGFVTSTMGNQIPAGAVLLMTITTSLLTATLNLSAPVTKRRFWGKTGLWTLVLAIQLLAIVYISARGPWVGTIVALVGFLGLLAVFTGLRTAAHGGLLLGTAIVITTAILSGLPQINRATERELEDPHWSASASVYRAALLDTGVPAVAARLATVGREVTGGGLSSRVEIWKISWRLIRHHPWVEFDPLMMSNLRPLVGYGPDLFKYAYLLERRPLGEGRQLVSNRFAHNFFVHNAVELGWIGLLTSVGIFLSVFAVGGYQALCQRNRYSELNKIMLAGLMAVIAGRFVEQSVGVAAVSDFTVFWALLALFVALPTVMGSPRPLLEPALGPPGRQLGQELRPPQASGFEVGQVGWQLAVAACMILAVGVLTWEKTVHYPLAAVKARQGYQELTANNLPGALESFDQAIALAPDVAVYRNLQASTYRGYRFQSNGAREPGCAQSKEAVSYETCLAREAYFRDREATMQRPFEWSGRLAEADSAWSLALLERDPAMAREAIRLFGEVAELNPQVWWIWEMLASAYIQLGEPEAAFDPLGRSLAILDGVSRSANTLVLRGMAYRESGDSDKALRDFNEAIQLNAALADAHSNLGAVYSDLGMYQRSIDALDVAIKLNPELAMAYNNRGNAHGNLGRLARAVKDYGEAIRLDPRLVLAYANRALAYTYLARDDDARKDVEKGIELGLDADPILAKIEEVKNDR